MTVSKVKYQKNEYDLSNVDPIKICKVSGSKGLKVNIVTLRGHVLEKYWDIISKEAYFFCPEKNCEIVYFNNLEKHYFSKKDVKTRVSYKTGEEPRPICYCLNVLEHKIIDEILVKKCCTSLEDIKQYTGARTGKLCHIRNPSGRCCGPQVNEVISRALKLLNVDKTDVAHVLEQIHRGCEYCIHDMEFIEESFDLVEEACKTCKIEWNKPQKSESDPGLLRTKSGNKNKLG